MPGKRPRPTDPIVQQRIAEVLRLRLDGAEAYDVRHYIAEKEAAAEVPWIIPEDGSPLSERQIRSYIQSADAQVGATIRRSSATDLRRHIALRRNLYRRALAAEDYRAAQSILADLAKLLDLYPAAKVNVNVREIDHAIEQLMADLGAPRETPSAGEAPPASGGNPPSPDGA